MLLQDTTAGLSAAMTAPAWTLPAIGCGGTERQAPLSQSLVSWTCVKDLVAGPAAPVGLLKGMHCTSNYNRWKLNWQLLSAGYRLRDSASLSLSHVMLVLHAEAAMSFCSIG